MSPDSRGCPGPVLETCLGLSSSPQGSPQPEILCQHKRHWRPDTAPRAHRIRNSELQTEAGLVWGAFWSPEKERG